MLATLFACVDPAPPAETAPPSTSPLPQVVVDTRGVDVDAESGTEGDRVAFPMRDVTVSVHAGSPDGDATLVSAAGMRVRGNSTQALPKKSYALELRDEAGDDRALPFVGLPDEADWVLLGPYADRSLLRDVLAYRWGRALGRWAPRTAFVELWVDADGGAPEDDDYRGVYAVVEKVERGDARVDVARMDPEDEAEPKVTGGWLVKVDVPDPDEDAFRTAAGTPPYWPAIGFLVEDPDPDDVTEAQRAWLRGWLDGFEAVLAGDDFADPQVGYAAWIDVDSFVDYHLLTEALKNADGFYASMYFHKDRQGRLVAGPIWDWNVAMGGTTDWDCYEPEGWLEARVESFWYPRLFEDPAFVARWRARWRELRAGPLADDAMRADVRAAAAEVDEAQARNFARWPVLGRPIDELPHLSYPGWEDRPTWESELVYLEDWLVARLAWMDPAVERR